MLHFAATIIMIYRILLYILPEHAITLAPSAGESLHCFFLSKTNLHVFNSIHAKFQVIPSSSFNFTGVEK